MTFPASATECRLRLQILKVGFTLAHCLFVTELPWMSYVFYSGSELVKYAAQRCTQILK